MTSRFTRNRRAPRAGILLAALLLPPAALLLAPVALAGPGGAAIELPGVAISDVAQTPFRDGFAQRIGVRGDPRGMAEVSVRTGGAAAGFGSALSLSKPSRAGITAELLTRFPGEVMRVVTTPRRNAYGPVGMALGNDCLYAWQWIDLGGRRERARPTGPSLFGGGEEGGAASIRIKLCRTATATLSDLARSVEQMRFTASPAGARLASESLASEPRAARARPERTRRPAPSTIDKTLAARPPVTAAPPGATERPRAARKQEGAAPDAPRYLTPGPGAVPPQPAVPAPAASGQGPAPRYITDGTPQAVNPPITAPKPAPNRAEFEDLLARELPARAYRPPP